MTTALDLDALTLSSGGHDANDDGEMCLLEAAAYLAGEPWSDHPSCVCPVLGAFGRSLNDRLPDAKRQQLKALLPELLGTADDGHQQQRAYLAADWAIRTHLPAWLRLTERIDPAQGERIENLSPITDEAGAQAAGVIVREIREQAYRARTAARTALIDKLKSQGGVDAYAYAAASDAAYAYAAPAASDAASASASAASDAAYAYAAAAASAYAAAYAASYAASASAYAYAYAAYAAAYAAASDAASAYAAVRAEAEGALASTAERMQDSAIELFARMVRIGAGA